MKHFVFWAPEADEKLRSLLVDDGDENGDLVRIVREIDVWLARNPLESGIR